MIQTIRFETLNKSNSWVIHRSEESKQTEQVQNQDIQKTEKESQVRNPQSKEPDQRTRCHDVRVRSKNRAIHRSPSLRLVLECCCADIH